MTKRVDTVETVVDVFNIAMDIQELYLKQGPFKQLSMSEMHVLEAVEYKKQVRRCQQLLII